jgi:hypothetical protein
MGIFVFALLMLFIVSIGYGMYGNDGWSVSFSINMMNTPYYKIGLFSERKTVFPDDDETSPFTIDEIVIGLLFLEFEFLFYKEIDA